MSASTKKIRAAVCRRAEGSCEHCGVWVGLNGELGGELDHAGGRGKGREKESAENCWLLCGGPRFPEGCHFRKTNNKPDAAYWLTSFIRHCGKFGFPTERAEARLEFVTARAHLKARGFEVVS